MGAYLSSPVRDKESEEGENDSYKYGISAMQGWRTDMEDAHAAVLDLPDSGTKSALFAVLDGHGGAEVARFVAKYLAQELVATEAYQANDVGRALIQSYLRIDELLVKEEFREELKALRAKDTEEEGDSGPMVINGASLPDSILEALGMPSGAGAGFQIKLVRSGPGARGISIDDIEEGEGNQESGRSGASIVEVVEDDPASAEEAAAAGPADEEDAGAAEDPALAAANEAAANEAAAAADRNSKRKRDDKAMEVDKAAAADAAGASGDGEQPPAGDEGAEAAGEDEGEAVEDATAEQDDYAGPSAGCTAVCAVVRNGVLYVANAGDSRCVLSRGGRAIAMTQDHKPMDTEEYARIMKAGGFVADGRVNGSLNLSRALGDLEYKQTKELGPEEQMVTAFPEIRQQTLQPGDEFLLLACDGIWDVLTNQEAVDFVRERLQAGRTPKEVCEDVCDRCLAPDTGGCGKGCDNMSVVVVQLKEYIK